MPTPYTPSASAQRAHNLKVIAIRLAALLFCAASWSAVALIVIHIFFGS